MDWPSTLRRWGMSGVCKGEGVRTVGLAIQRPDGTRLSNDSFPSDVFLASRHRHEHLSEGGEAEGGASLPQLDERLIYENEPVIYET